MNKPVNKMPPIHPGEILAEELEAIGLSARQLAVDIGVPANRVSAILRGTRAVTADTDLRLSAYFGTTPGFWLDIQKTYELREAEIARGAEIRKAIKRRAA
jgi:addiction module HigA family antidote